MFAKFNPAAAGFGALMMALAFVGVTQVIAQTAPTTGDGGSGSTYSTTCGAGTIEKCGETPTVSCDWEFHFAYNPLTRSIELTIGKTDCKKTGSIPIYKNKDATSLLSGSCDFLAPFLGLPAGTNCSE